MVDVTVQDIIEAGVLEIESRFLDFEGEVLKIAYKMAQNEMKLQLLGAYYIDKFSMHELKAIIHRATSEDGKVRKEMLNYIEQL